MITTPDFGCPIDNERFLSITEEVTDSMRGMGGIGTLGEKTIHAVLKQYYEPNTLYHEQKTEGYVADVFDGAHIYEVQTRNFNTLRRKLSAFLPKYPVTIVYPLVVRKRLHWIDQTTGEITKPIRSYKTGSLYKVFNELYRIKSFLTDPNLSFIITLLDVDEYRMLDGWGRDHKRGSTRNDGIPAAILGEYRICCPQDYLVFVPAELPEQFTVKEYKTAAKIPQRFATVCLHVLHYIGVLERVGKRGNCFVYQVLDD